MVARTLKSSYYYLLLLFHFFIHFFFIFSNLLMVHSSDFYFQKNLEYLLLRDRVFCPEGRPGMSDVIVLSGISGLSFDSPCLSPLLFFLPGPLALSVLSFFC